MKSLRLRVLLLFVPLAAGCAAGEVRLAEVSGRISAAGKKHDEAAIRRLALSIGPEALGAARLGGYPEEELNSVYDALLKAALYLPDEESHALRLESVFEEKLKRGKYTEDDVAYMEEVFLMAGLFEKAGALKRRFPLAPLEEVPSVSSSGAAREDGWPVYKISENGRAADLRRISRKGPVVIMVMRPGCEFAEMAAQAIFSDKELAAGFRSRGIILTRKFEPVRVEEIKKRFGFEAVYIARKTKDFPGLSLMGVSPSFYFLKNGKIRYEFSGWSNEDGGQYAKENIRKGFAAVGISAAG